MPDFYGHPTDILENTHLRLEYLSQGGPRIVRLSLAGSNENILGEFPEHGWDTPQGYYQLLGGHRLWAAPEVPGTSYMPDAAGLAVRETSSGVELTWEPGPTAHGRGLAKSLEVSLAAERPAVHLRHRLTNRYDHPVRIAIWGITAFPLGGRAYLPCPPSGQDFEPDRTLAIWPYSRWDDPRIKFSPAGIMVNGRAGTPPIKVGTFSASGGCAYHFPAEDPAHERLFTLCFEAAPGEYPDRGCNVEIYCSDRLMEIETLGPLADVPPGGSITGLEIWEIHTGAAAARKLDEIFPIGDES